ncbi:MAG: tRNA epoxyqueuosine(34) reductase QueG [Bacteroidales bacterium]|nr:tRNA epoxyqueuosine(34) reductase QueG [Bacteroidales bacterium]
MSKKIKQAATEIGFDGCGFCRADFLEEDAGFLNKWLQNGMHQDMHYMENHFEKRVNPAKLVEGAKSVISVFLNYYPSKIQNKKNVPIISKYAYGEDYHFVIKNLLLKLLEKINREIAVVNGRAFVDSAPLLERALAREAGLGWIGKNTNLINPKFGSFIFLGELVIDLELEYDKPLENKCGNCTKCLQACPTKALIKPHVLNSQNCISYLTIEHKHNLPVELSDKFNNIIFGCDICQDVCPFNKKAKPNEISQFQPKEELLEMTVEQWHSIDKEHFDKLFSKSAVKRTKYNGLIRNLEFVKS